VAAELVELFDNIKSKGFEIFICNFLWPFGRILPTTPHKHTWKLLCNSISQVLDTNSSGMQITILAERIRMPYCFTGFLHNLKTKCPSGK
jgi:hypothetical protein